MTASARRAFAAFLFDMDGTVLDSIAAANRIWRRWAGSHGIDVDGLLATMHGMRVGDTVRRWAPPGVDVERESAAITRAEIDDVEGIVAIPGARRLLEALPADRWAVVTSAPRELALRRMAAAGIPVPAVLVTAEDVVHGKPAPDGFLLAARRLGVDARDCAIWEDAPAGIAAAEAAGGTVFVMGATHTHPMTLPHPVVASYDGLAVTIAASGALVLAGVPG